MKRLFLLPLIFLASACVPSNDPDQDGSLYHLSGLKVEAIDAPKTIDASGDQSHFHMEGSSGLIGGSMVADGDGSGHASNDEIKLPVKIEFDIRIKHIDEQKSARFSDIVYFEQVEHKVYFVDIFLQRAEYMEYMKMGKLDHLSLIRNLDSDYDRWNQACFTLKYYSRTVEVIKLENTKLDCVSYNRAHRPQY